MKMFSKFANDESGAVTVDWVVLAGVVIAFGLAVSTVLGPLLTDSMTNVGTNLTTETSSVATLGASE